MEPWISSEADLAAVRRAADDVDRVGPTGWGREHCPLCVHRVGSADHRGALGIDFNSGYFHCFRCRARGRLRGFGETVDHGPPRPRQEERPTDPELGPPDGFEPLWKEPGATALSFAAARRYLASRGVHPQTVEEARIGACLRGSAKGRIVVPILSIDGGWLGWQARVWVKRHPLPYLSATGMDREANVFNPAALRVDTDVPVMVVEGTYDALPYWPDVVALLGQPSEGQIALLLSAPRPIVVALDGDTWLGSEMLAARLCMDGADASWVKLPPTRDPGDVQPAWLSDSVVDAARRGFGQ